mgnify:CR=1 FL=1
MRTGSLILLLSVALSAPARDAEADSIRKAVTFYASFDDEVKGDFGKGQLTFDTRTNHPTEKGKYVVEKGFSDKAFRIAKNKGVAGGALEAVDVLPKNGRIFVPVMRPYFPICWARCPSSGRMSLLIASRTAFSEPGIRKITVLPAVPAVARLSIAAGPMSS